MKPKLAGQETPVTEQQQQQDETPAVTAQAGLATASSVIPAQEPGTEEDED